MSTNQIFDKVAALKTQDEQVKQEEKKRRGVWSEVETFVDKASGIGVVVTERMRGRPSYSFQIVHFDDHGGNKFVPLPCEGAQRPIKEIVYLLIEQAEKLIEEKRAENAKNRPPRKDNKQHRRFKTGQSAASGLSDLARRDAEKKRAEEGEFVDFVGKTAKKKGGKK